MRIDPKRYARLGVPFPRERTWIVHACDESPVAAAHLMGTPAPSLRLVPLGDGLSARDLRAIEALADAEGAAELRTQCKLADGSGAALALVRAGYACTEPSEVFDVAVDRAGPILARCGALAARLGNSLSVATLAAGGRGAVGPALHRAELLDAAELEGRLAMAGRGGIDAGECPVLLGAEGVVGTVVVARSERADTREILARWVAPHLQGALLPNLRLLQAALDMAGDAGVSHVRFAANPARHRETLALARRLSGRRVGTRRGLRKYPTGDPDG